MTFLVNQMIFVEEDAFHLYFPTTARYYVSKGLYLIKLISSFRKPRQLGMKQTQPSPPLAQYRCALTCLPSRSAAPCALTAELRLLCSASLTAFHRPGEFVLTWRLDLRNRESYAI